MAFTAWPHDRKVLMEIARLDWNVVIRCDACERERVITAVDLVRRVPRGLGATLQAFADRLRCEVCPDGGWGGVYLRQGHTLRLGPEDYAPYSDRIAQIIAEATGEGG